MFFKRQILLGFNTAISEVGLQVIAFVSFAVYVYTGHELTPRKAFVTISLLQVFRTYVLLLALVAANLTSESWVAIRRIQVKPHCRYQNTFVCHMNFRYFEVVAKGFVNVIVIFGHTSIFDSSNEIVYIHVDCCVAATMFPCRTSWSLLKRMKFGLLKLASNSR